MRGWLAFGGILAVAAGCATSAASSAAYDYAPGRVHYVAPADDGCSCMLDTGDISAPLPCGVTLCTSFATYSCVARGVEIDGLGCNWSAADGGTFDRSTVDAAALVDAGTR